MITFIVIFTVLVLLAENVNEKREVNKKLDEMKDKAAGGMVLKADLIQQIKTGVCEIHGPGMSASDIKIEVLNLLNRLEKED